MSFYVLDVLVGVSCFFLLFLSLVVLLIIMLASGRAGGTVCRGARAGGGRG
jgi:hypothetical protein